MKSALVIHHIAYEAIAGFRAPLEAAGYALSSIVVTDPAYPAVDLLAPDLLVLMGGPMGVYEQAEHPWIAPHLVRIAARIAAERPTLGVCLGAQIIAAALGARVYAGPHKELGFSPLHLTREGLASPLRHLAGQSVLHWHGDSFDLPPDCTLLASTPLYPHQAFARGRHLLALQFHGEMGEDAGIEQWIAASDAMIAAAGTTPQAVREEYARLGPATLAAGRAMLTEWLAGLSVQKLLAQ